MVAASITAKPATGSEERMKGPLCVSTRGVVVTHLHRFPGDSHVRSTSVQSRVMRVRRISYGWIGAVVPLAIAISNRHELRHLESFPIGDDALTRGPDLSTQAGSSGVLAGCIAQ